MNAFWSLYVWPTAIIVAEVIAVAVPLLLAIAYFTYAERKVLAYSQLRKGPNVVGPMGLFQPIADGLKLLMKETVIPSGANRVSRGPFLHSREASLRRESRRSRVTRKRPRCSTHNSISKRPM